MAANKQAGRSAKTGAHGKPTPPTIDLEATEVRTDPMEQPESGTESAAAATIATASDSATTEAAGLEAGIAPQTASAESTSQEAASAPAAEIAPEAPAKPRDAPPSEPPSAGHDADLLGEVPPSADRHGAHEPGLDAGVGVARLLASGVIGGAVALAVAGGALYSLGWLPPVPPPASAPAEDSVAVDLSTLQGRVDELAARLDKVGETASAADLQALGDRLKVVENDVKSLPQTSGATIAPDAFANLESGVADARDRLAAAEAAVTELKSRETAPAADLRTLEGRVDALEPLKGEIETNAAGLKDLAPLAGRIDALEKLSANVAKEGEIASLAIAAVGLSGKIASGLPYAAEFRMVAAAAPDLGGLAALKAHALTGVPTLSELAASLPEAAMMEKRPVPLDKGWMAGVVEGAKSLVNYRETGPGADDPASRAIAGIRAALAAGDAPAAEAAAGDLPEWARTVASDWLARLMARVDADKAVAALTDRLAARLGSPLVAD